MNSNKQQLSRCNERQFVETGGGPKLRSANPVATLAGFKARSSLPVLQPELPWHAISKSCKRFSLLSKMLPGPVNVVVQIDRGAAHSQILSHVRVTRSRVALE